MNKGAILSITLLASITLVVPNVYAEEEGSFFDWLLNLFDGLMDKDATDSIDSTIVEQLDSKKAVIIDQLYRDLPNSNYHNKTIYYLTEAGYDVDLYTTEDITVDFYKELPSMDYEFIVIRSHSLAIYGDKPSSWLFTGEMYSDEKHTFETMAGQLSPGVPFLITQELEEVMSYSEAAKKRHFMIGSKFVDEKMEGKFPGSVIILGGCETLTYPFLADSFIKRGASSIVGWNDLVEYRDNDRVTIALLNEILINGLEINDAVESVMEKYMKNKSNIKLKHYSSGADLEI